MRIGDDGHLSVGRRSSRSAVAARTSAKRLDEQLAEPRRRHDVDEEVGCVVDAREDVRRVKDDATERRSVDELDHHRRDHPRRLADQKHRRDADQRARQSPVLQRPSTDHVRRPVDALRDPQRRVDGVRRGAGRGRSPLLPRLLTRSRNSVAVDHAGQDDVEDEDDDDDDVADHELDQRGQYPPGRRVGIFPAHPVGALLCPAEDDGVDMRHADDAEQRQNDDASLTRRAESTSAVRIGDTYDPFQGEAGDQPVGVVPGNAVGVVGRATVSRMSDEALWWNYLLRPRTATTPR